MMATPPDRMARRLTRTSVLLSILEQLVELADFGLRHLVAVFGDREASLGNILGKVLGGWILVGVALQENRTEDSCGELQEWIPFGLETVLRSFSRFGGVQNWVQSSPECPVAGFKAIK
jgi:hypothetical protein